MNAYLSDKIRVISLITMVLLTFVHAYTFPSITFHGEVFSWEGLSFAVQYSVSQGLAKFRLPMFFILSGYFFIRSVHLSEVAFLPQFLKRLRTVALPYLLWSSIGFLIYLFLQWPQTTRSLFPHNQVWGLPFSGVVGKILFDPIPYQLWFLRDLMVLFALSPLIMWCIRRVGAWVLVPPLLCWLLEWDPVILGNESLPFFIAGGWLAMRGPDQEPAMTDRTRRVILISWLSTIVVKTALVMNGHVHQEVIRQLHHFCVFLGLISVWVGYDLVLRTVEVREHWMYRFTAYSFFLYAAHEPCLTMVKHVLLHFLGGHPLAVLVCYFTAPMITMIVCLAVARALLQFAPRFYGLLTGGRGIRRSAAAAPPTWATTRAA